MAKAYVKFLKDYEQVTPATVIESFIGDKKVSEIPVPERRYTYQKDSTHTFRSKKDAKAFVAAVGTDVCVLV